MAELLGSKGHDPQCKVQLEANNQWCIPGEDTGAKPGLNLV